MKASVDTHAELHVHDFDLFLLFLRSEIVCLWGNMFTVSNKQIDCS